jgi:hypothetical protein
MGAKLKNDFSPMKNNPGPGTYELMNRDNSNMNRSAQWKMGSQERLPKMRTTNMLVPGPGNYQISLSNKTTAPRYGFGSGTRDEMKTKLQVPGPGQYVAKSVIGTEGTKSSMHAKIEYKPIEKTSGDTPGPGNYSLSFKNKQASPAYKLGTQKRDSGQSKTFQAPSPNKYLPNMTFTQSSAAKWGFGSGKRDEMGAKSLSPGPGNYEIKSRFSEKPRFHVGIKIAESKPTTDVPGAGHYNPDSSKVMKSLPRFSMKAKLGSSLVGNSFAPGPGNYEVHLKNKNAAPRFGFGSSKREGMGSKSISPGPGAYAIASTVGDVPSYSKGN